MIDRNYGHLARDGREHAIRLLDSYADLKAADVQDLDARWTPQLPIVAGHDNGNRRGSLSCTSSAESAASSAARSMSSAAE